jgi:hypothetical protein
METQDIKDFSDLGQAVMFTYNKAKFAIPPLSRAAMTNLLRINQKISDHVRKRAPKKEGVEAESEEQANDIQDMDDLFGLQQEFIVNGVRKVSEEGQFGTLAIEQVEEWPMKMKHQVIMMINDALTTTTKGDERPT